MDARRQQPHKASGYRQLVERYGHDRVATAVLAKWISDRDAGDKWEHLYAVVAVAPRKPEGNHARPYKYWVILWYLSMGYKAQDVADQLGLGVESVKQELKYARLALGMAGRPMPQVVAAAIRKGVIP